MNDYTKNFLKALRNILAQPVESGEKSSDFYDDISDRTTKLYVTSRYYCVWTVIIDRLRKFGRHRILEIGCGTGWLANACDEAGVLETYFGIDFSSVRVAHARRINPGLEFGIEDICF